MTQAINTIGGSLLQEEALARGVLMRRFGAWCIDMVLIGILTFTLWLAIAAFGVVTLGLGFSLLPVLAAVPFAYNWLFLSSVMSATPGQATMGLQVRRNDDMAPPNWVEAAVWTLFYYVTLALFFPLLLVALFTHRNRALHDILSGLAVVRKRALTM